MHSVLLVAALLFTGAPAEVREPDKPVVLTFWTAKWCSTCQLMHPTVDRLIAEGWPVAYADYDQYPEIAKTWELAALPTCIVHRNGVEQSRLVGYAKYEQLVRLLRDAGGRQNSGDKDNPRSAGPVVSVLRAVVGQSNSRVLKHKE